MKFRLSAVLVGFVIAASAQNVSSSLMGLAVDPSGAPVPAAVCQLVNQATGAVSSVKSAADGSFTFPNIFAGTYTLTVKSSGFKTFEMKDIFVSSSETRSVGRVTLQIGDLLESVSVQAEATAVQVASAERSGVVTGAQLNDIALKGRDFFALLATIPGVVDTRASRETTTNASNGGIFINGARDNQKNFAVDGITDMDVGSNQSLAFMPNMDSIAEVKILTSNYQAEYGRNSGGMVTVITKSGTKELHGSAYNFYRHESLNANSFYNNRTGTQKAPYRYRISGYSIGGPIYIPQKFNTNKEKFFFFFSQEYTGVKQDFGSKFVNVPTELERRGDFSQSMDINGALIVIRDPNTGQPFPGNIIPQNRISKLGQSILGFFPTPNFTDPDPRNRYRRNYRSVFSGNTPRRNDILRVDANLSPTFTMYYRYGHDKDIKSLPWDDWKTGSTNYLLSPVYVENPGSGHLVRTTKTFSPTLVNEFIFGHNRMRRDFDVVDPSLLARARMGNPPEWFPNPPTAKNYIPNVSFGGQPANPVVVAPATIPNSYKNPNLTFTNNLTAIRGKHNLKAGIYVERVRLEHISNVNYRGSFDFSRNVNNPFDSNHSFANALLGNFSSYSEASNAPYAHWGMWQIEWYLQDNWRVTRRLTLDFGTRFYRMQPLRDLDGVCATFDPALYVPAKAPVLYTPGRNAAGQRVAVDPTTGRTTFAALIGLFVPGTGDPANGAAVAGKNGYPASLITRPWLSYGPRFGFAYDVFGNGKTAIRGGFGWFQDTGQTNPIRNTPGNPPTAYTPTLFYGNLDSYAQSAGAIGPSNLGIIFGPTKLPNNMNFSLGVQRQIWGTLLDASYVGGLSRHLQVTANLNVIGMYARFDPKNQDPTQPGRPLPDNFFRPYPGYGNLNMTQWSGTSNYNALQFSANRRYTRGLQFGVAYTFSKALGTSSADGGTLSPYFPPRSRNYGPLSFDRTQMLVINYMYDLPRVGARLGFKPAGWVLDRWQISGITSFISGAAFTPGFSTVDGEDITGSGEGAAITVVGDPRLDKSERTYYRNFKTEMFRRTPSRSFGNAGVGILRGPGINNWDISVTKRVPLFSEARFIQFRTELFNAWNHTQFSGLYTTARFDLAGNQTDPNFGAYSSARLPRIIQLSLKVIF
jgi:hypothetical protein